MGENIFYHLHELNRKLLLIKEYPPASNEIDELLETDIKAINEYVHKTESENNEKAKRTG